MQTKIVFVGGTIGGAPGTTLGTFNHENMHQWLGDNVAEAAFNLTFFKEGFATLGEYLARRADGGRRRIGRSLRSRPGSRRSLIGHASLGDRQLQQREYDVHGSARRRTRR